VGYGPFELNASGAGISIGWVSLSVIWLIEQDRDGPQCFDLSLDAGEFVFFRSQHFLNVSH